MAKTESRVASKLPASSTQKHPTFTWVVQEAIPISVVESPAFQAFVEALNPSFKRDKETTSANDNREANAARKTEESACMVDGNAKMVLNVPTQAPLSQGGNPVHTRAAQGLPPLPQGAAQGSASRQHPGGRLAEGRAEAHC
ncbi:hypothetical protein QJQ45_002472 [Haematococcus lacustris]|nr:hypothetical protein QJQ45_002472 [Haematococcus lacustris]